MVNMTLDGYIKGVKAGSIILQDELEKNTPENLIRLRNIYCFKMLKRDIEYIFEDKYVNITYDNQAFSMTINKSIGSESQSEPIQLQPITITVNAENLEYINISLKDPKAFQPIKNFYIRPVEGSNKGGDEFMRVKRHICLYLRDKEGSWIWKKE